MDLLKKYGVSEYFKSLCVMYPDLHLARVTGQHKGLYKIVTGNLELSAEISGRFRHETTDMIGYPTVGDFVMVTADETGGSAVIHNVLERKSIFLRTAVGTKGQAQPIAANIDTIFICMSLNENFNLSRLERYLGIAWDSGATPVIILTKSDLCEDLKGRIEEVERISSYADIITLSIFDEDIEKKLSGHINKGKTITFVGSSGVGKSTLINKLLGDEKLATADIGKGGKGRHTTTGREMFLSQYGDVLIDTPGMRELGAQGVDLSMTFDDIEELAAYCKYTDCSHSTEKGCAVLQAIEEGRLEKRRYENYLKLKKEVGYEGLSSREIEEKKFVKFGGVKKMRKIGNEIRKNKHR